MRSSSFLLLSVSALLSLTSCEARFEWPWLEKKAAIEELQTTGQTGTEDRSVGVFDRIQLDGIGRLLFDSEVPAGILRIQADEGVLPAVETTVTDGLLLIRERDVPGPDDWDLEFRVAPPAGMKEITLGGMGTIESVQPLKSTSPLTIALQGMGRIELAVEAPEVTARQKGSGELVVRGKADSVTLFADGLGRVDASELKTPKADVQSHGLGEVEVYASEFLKVRAQGLGAVHFWGQPTQTDVQTEGLTKVTAAD